MINELLKNAEESNWIEKAQWRTDNEYWIEKSFNIGLDVTHELSENRDNGRKPSDIKELAEEIGIHPYELRVMLSGSHNFDLKTICKIEMILGIKILK